MGGAVAGADLPLGWIAPFAILLFAIALLPLASPRWWKPVRNQLLFALACGVPTAIYMAWYASGHGVGLSLRDHSVLSPVLSPVLSALHEYVAFLLLLFALFVIAGGIHIQGTLAGTPLVNTSILGTGALLASIVGTTGASMLLIRPLLRANAVRKRTAHVFVFFVFVVSNCGGLLTPLGSPPLFLGFLRGADFTFTLQLWKPWLLVNGALLLIFQFLDSHYFHREDVEEKRRDLDAAVEEAREPFGIEGGLNFLWLAGVIAALFCSGRSAWPAGVQEAAILAFALASILTTRRAVRTRNRFSYAPIVGPAVLFLGVFLSMAPALMILNARSADLGIDSPREFFWASGALASFLPDAPTYLASAAVAAGLHHVAAEGPFVAALGRLGAEPASLLAAISCGVVMMGANTYLGNGTNLIVKSIAEHAGVRMPGFFGYMGWSIAVLIPLFVLVTFVCF